MFYQSANTAMVKHIYPSRSVKIAKARLIWSTLHVQPVREVEISRNGGALWLPFNEGLFNPYAATNGNHVSSPMVLSADNNYLYFGSGGSGVFRRLIGDDYLLYLPVIGK